MDETNWLTQKQSIGVIQIQGMILSNIVSTAPFKLPGGNRGEGGLKQMSASVQFLNTVGYIQRRKERTHSPCMKTL